VVAGRLLPRELTLPPVSQALSVQVAEMRAARPPLSPLRQALALAAQHSREMPTARPPPLPLRQALALATRHLREMRTARPPP